MKLQLLFKNGQKEEKVIRMCRKSSVQEDAIYYEKPDDAAGKGTLLKHDILHTWQVVPEDGSEQLLLDIVSDDENVAVKAQASERCWWDDHYKDLGIYVEKAFEESGKGTLLNKDLVKDWSLASRKITPCGLKF